MEDTGQLYGVVPPSSPFTRVPGIELGTPGLCGKHLYSMSHLNSPADTQCVLKDRHTHTEMNKQNTERKKVSWHRITTANPTLKRLRRKGHKFKAGLYYAVG